MCSAKRGYNSDRDRKKVFKSLESISNKSKAELGVEFLCFSNMSLEIVPQFVFQNSEIILEKSKKLVWTEKFPA